MQQFFKNAAEVWASSPRLRSQWSCIRVVFLGQAAGKWKFFDPTIFQKCWRGSGRAALIAARRQRNPCAMLLAHGEGGEKSDSFSRRGEQDRLALWNLNQKHVSCNCSGGTVAMKYYFIENPAPRENDFQRPAKGGSTPAFACQRAAIAPLPCLNLQPSSLSFNFVWIGKF